MGAVVKATQSKLVIEQGADTVRGTWYTEVQKPYRVTLLSGENAGEEVTSVKNNQKVVIEACTIAYTRWHVLVAPNPGLFTLGAVNTATVLEAEQSHVVRLYLKADKAFDVADLPWLVRLYVLD